MKYFLACLLTGVVACNSPQKATESDLMDSTTVSQDATATAPETVLAKAELITQNPTAAAVSDTTQPPMGTIKLLVDGQEVWQKQVPGIWKPFDMQYSKSMNVPKEAISAYQSEWKFSSTVFYLVRENNKWAVKSCLIEEGGEEGAFEYTTEKEVPVSK